MSLVLTRVSEIKGDSSIKDHHEELGNLMISDRKKTRVAGWRRAGCLKDVGAAGAFCYYPRRKC